MKAIGAALFTVFFSMSAHAGTIWDGLIKASGLNKKHHAYCYFNRQGELTGSNIHKKAYLASITKLMTTYAVAKKFGTDYKHQTVFYYDKASKKMHIEGGMDPLFTYEKTFYLVNQFNRHGIEEIKSLTFDDNTLIYPKSHLDRQNSPVISNDKKAQYLFDHLHTPGWNVLLTRYRDFYKKHDKELLDFLSITNRPSELKLSLDKVTYAKNIPFDKEGEDVIRLVHLSPKVENFLKFMNVKSHNYYADEYLNVVGKESFDKIMDDFMNEHFQGYEDVRVGFKSGEPSIGIFNGSGLPAHINGVRKDNYATCAIVVTMIRELDREIEAIERKIEESVAVTGIDLGTIKNRMRGNSLKNKAIVKTGTTNPVSALAGMMNAHSGRRYFGIFNHRQMGGGRLSAGPLRSFQDELVYKLMKAFDGGVSLGYKRKSLNVLESNLIVE
jgi:D-alanyl-D-alanine carboxypeptidase/D-alanyl-D-alanine-endopeptidase (penicillin-binding protein 4)